LSTAVHYKFDIKNKITIIIETALLKGGNVMAKVIMITYECDRCGTEVVVSPTSGAQLSPIYCCGMAVVEVSSVEKTPAETKKKAVKKVAKKVSKKKVAPKKKPAAKKKTSKK
jgi:uncharacterized Zn finger protein (UPF0148 family)